MLFTLLGVLVILAVFGDFLQTTLGAHRAGRLSRNISAAAWRVSKFSRHALGARAHTYSGPAILTLTAMVWIILIWLGWTLFFLGGDPALVMSQTDAPAGLFEMVAYVGAAISTLGASRAEATHAFWDTAAAVAAVNGMVVLTLSVSFVLNITQTVAKGREFAILIDAHDANERFDLVREKLASLTPQIGAYPMSLYFSSSVPAWQVVPAINEFVQTTLTDTRLTELRPILSILPDFDADGDVDALKAEMRRWSERFSLDHVSRA